MVALRISEDLAEMAQEVPGLDDRVARFIRLEVEKYRLRQKRFSPAAIEIVARAKSKAKEKRALGFDEGAVASEVRLELDALFADSGA